MTLVSIVEIVWVLSSAYSLSREQISHALDALLRSRQLVVDQAEHVLRALRVFGQGSADFADCLIERTAHAAGCERTMTFDIAASKTAGMTLIG
ncbi:PIN domain-containing protein [Variovorax rhizosphaerae]|uniref:PIN domain-containing protein n=1 Tax=Variovorax rhizosphaerae TaxID=1836200 RepID=A0ABU8WPA5_9BURK